MAKVAGLPHDALSVRDLDASASGCAEVVGMVEEVRLGDEDRRSVIVRPVWNR